MHWSVFGALDVWIGIGLFDGKIGGGWGMGDV